MRRSTIRLLRAVQTCYADHLITLLNLGEERRVIKHLVTLDHLAARPTRMSQKHLLTRGAKLLEIRLLTRPSRPAPRRPGRPVRALACLLPPRLGAPLRTRPTPSPPPSTTAATKDTTL